MNTIQKSEAIKDGLRKGFHDGSSKMAKRKCYGYKINSDGELEINPDEQRWCAGYLNGIYLAIVWEKLLLAWKSRASPPPLVGPNGTGRRLTNCSPKNTPDGYCFKKRSVLARFK